MFPNYILPSIPVVLVAGYCTSVVCRLALWFHRRVGWSFAIVGAVVAAGASIAFRWLGLSLQPGEIPYCGYFAEWALIVSIGGSLLAIFPAEVLVWYYRQRQREYSHGSQAARFCSTGSGVRMLRQREGMLVAGLAR